MPKESWVLEKEMPHPYKLLHLLSRGAFQLPPHSHSFWQIIIVTEGRLTVSAGPDVLELCAGMVHILPPGMEHSLESVEGYSQLGIDLEAEDRYPLSVLLKQYIREPTVHSDRGLLEIYAELEGIYHYGVTQLSAARLVNLADSLVLRCIETCGAVQHDRWAEQLTGYLDSNLSKAMCVSEIAEHFYLSVPQLERRCRGAYHCGVIAHLLQRRYRRAKFLLLNTDYSVQEIGAMVGYPEAAHFSAFFRSYAGISPRAFRQKSRMEA